VKKGGLRISLRRLAVPDRWRDGTVVKALVNKNRRARRNARPLVRRVSEASMLLPQAPSSLR
jgi:hypothetical protein